MRRPTPSGKVLVFAEDVLQQLRSGVGDFRLITDVSRAGQRYSEPDDLRNLVERSQMLPRYGKDVESSQMSRLAPRFYIEFRADAPDELDPRPSVAKIPVRKSRLPVCTASA